MRHVFRSTAIVAVASGLAWVAASLADASGGFGGLIDLDTLAAFFLETSFGSIWLVRLALLAALFVASFLANRPNHRSGTTAFVAAASGLLLTSQARIGHPAASTGAEGWFVTAAYAAHVLGGGAWLGGLAPLWFVVRQQTAKQADNDAFVLHRFSNMGFVAIGLILAGGGVNLWARWDFREPLFNSEWGKVLLAKAMMLLALLTLATINRLVLTPILLRNTRARKRIVNNVVFELGLGLLILAAAAILGILPPPGG